MSLNGEPLNHFSGISAFAEYAVVSRHAVIPIDADIPMQVAALFGCAVMTGVGAVVNTAQVPAGASVAVVGLGGVGLSALLGALACGADPVIAVDVNADKLALASALGATHIFDAGDDGVEDEILEITRGGVAYAFEMAGAVAAMEIQKRPVRANREAAGVPRVELSCHVARPALMSNAITRHEIGVAQHAAIDATRSVASVPSSLHTCILKTRSRSLRRLLSMISI